MIMPDYGQFGQIDFSSGIVPGVGILKYPELWRDCQLAYCPSLGFTGNAWRDFSGNNLHGDPSGGQNDVDWAILGDGYAGSWDGTNSIVRNIDFPDLTGPPYSMCCWFHAYSIAQYRGIIGGNSLAGEMLLSNTFVPTYMWTGASDEFNATGTAISANTDYFCAITITSDEAIIYTYGNNTVDVRRNTKTHVPVSIFSDLRIGAERSFGGRFWDGWIDDIRIYNRILTSSETSILASKRGASYEVIPIPHHISVASTPTELGSAIGNSVLISNSVLIGSGGLIL